VLFLATRRTGLFESRRGFLHRNKGVFVFSKLVVVINAND
jgi:hypothetical protein